MSRLKIIFLGKQGARKMAIKKIKRIKNIKDGSPVRWVLD
jgi:hypothetical protein